MALTAADMHMETRKPLRVLALLSRLTWKIDEVRRGM
jgi:hypothetical protein